jgi:uncharacterized phiE125 gp8 family phage protein
MTFLKRLEEPDSEPVTVEELRDHLRVYLDDEDSLLENWIKCARQDFERRTRRCLVPSSWKLGMFNWANPMYLPIAPVSTITHIKYYDGSNNLQTLDSSTYYLEDMREPGAVRFYLSQTRPIVSIERLPPIEVTFEAGYEDVPPDICQAIKILAGMYHEYRTEVSDPPAGYLNLCRQYALNTSPEWNDKRRIYYYGGGFGRW